MGSITNLTKRRNIMRAAKPKIAKICTTNRDEKGPNGEPVGCNDDGDLIEFVDYDGELHPEVFLRGEHNIVTAVSELIRDQCIRQDDQNAPDISDFEQGMIFGKLAALEWVEGGEWNSLIKIVNREADDPFNIRRSHRDILRIVNQLTEKVWWNRHQIWLENISAGTEQIRCEEIFAAAKKAARRVERKYGKRNLGWNDLDWGVLNGQLSALRWVTGDEWDMLDT
jgi:hypothetical protein